MNDLQSIFGIGDEFVQGPLKGLRFWTCSLFGTYDFPPRTIRSFQHDDIDWAASRPAQADMLPTMENERGLNVYKTEADALRGSADAVEGVAEDINGHWIERRRGLVLGEVDFWGPTIEWEFGYTAQYVRPARFLRGWGYKPEQMVDDLNTLWFGNREMLSFSESVLLSVQRGGVITAADIGGKLTSIFATLAVLEDKGLVSWRHAAYDDGVMYQHLKDGAWVQGGCLRCHRAAREDGACKNSKPRLYQITFAGQEMLLCALRGEFYG